MVKDKGGKRMSEEIEQPKELQPELPLGERKPNYVTVHTESFHEKYAGFWIRFWAYLIDLSIVAAISGIVVKPIFRVVGVEIANPSFLLFTPYKVTALVLLLLYFTLMTKFLQQTIGKMIMGIKVVQENGERLTWGTVVFRETIGRFISKLLVIPYLFVLFMPKKQALHDLFADTVVEHEHTYEKVLVTKHVYQHDGQQLQEGTVV